ncbi:MAG: hypothetical protein JSR85_07170 [Proteobacteria bacterium]|nr:hypothetical protein [Pseudomonadota bacterium]
MKEKFLLYLTDKHALLYRGVDEKLGLLKSDFDTSHQEILKALIQSPTTPISLLVDRGHQDIQEEKVPVLLPWDRFRFLSHKKAQWTMDGGLAGFQFLKQEKERFFRWIHLSQDDPLNTWVAWIKSLSNPFGGIFFVPLEIGKFLRYHFPSTKKFQMFLYPVSFQENRHAIFKGDRLLLSRALQGEEDLRTSLHYLSRSFPDIHEDLHVISLLTKKSKFLSKATTLSEFGNFIRFLAEQRTPAILLRSNISQRVLWLRISVGVFLLIVLSLTVIRVYQGINYKNRSSAFLYTLNEMKIRSRDLKHLLKDVDVKSFQRALEQYNYLKSLQMNPLETLDKLSSLIKKHHLYLESIRWIYEKKPEIILSFFMNHEPVSGLSMQIDLFISSCEELFPDSHVFVLEAPYNSGPQQVFNRLSLQSLPRAQVRIAFK